MALVKCLIIDEMFDNLNDLLSGIGIEPSYEPNITREELIGKIGNFQGLIVRSKTRIDREVLDPAKNLKFIARAGAGIDNIDEEVCAEKNITIFNAPEANRDTVGEQALGMLLSLYHNLNKGDLEVRKGIWEREGNRGIEIYGKTVGIIGFGNMGQAFARRLQGFNCKIIAYDKYKSVFGTSLVSEVDLETLFEESDILSLHVPLTSDTNRMVDGKFLNRFKKSITLINTARGKVVVLRDLIEAIHSGKVKAAALDVLENEKIDQLNEAERRDFSELIKLPNVLLTPHVAGWSFESYEKINDILVEKIGKFIQG